MVLKSKTVSEFLSAAYFNMHAICILYFKFDSDCLRTNNCNPLMIGLKIYLNGLKSQKEITIYKFL